MIDFSLNYFIIATIVTIIPFLWIIKEKDEVKLYFYVFCILFYYMICGVTSYLYPNRYYILYYLVYTLTFAFTLYLTRNKKIDFKLFKSESFVTFVNSKAEGYIKFYLLYCFFGLLYPVNKLGNLIHFASPDGVSALENSMEHSMGDSIQQLLSIIFFVFLSKYVHQPKKLIGILFVQTYISYASTAYLSRGAILRLLVVVFFLFYFNYPKIRKWLILAGIGSISSLLIFFVSYMYARMGDTFQAVSLSTALQKIAEIELSFSLHFDQVLMCSPSAKVGFGRFISWLLFLPFPGFMKPWVINESFNVLYTYDVLGLSPDDLSFFVTLPGLAIEGLYLFGPMLYPLHAALFAIVINYLINTLRQSSAFTFLCIYYIINVPFGAIRAGTQSFYATCFKILPYAVILLYFWYNISTSKNRKE